MPSVAEMAKISVRPSGGTEKEKVFPPPSWVRYVNHLIERNNGSSSIPLHKASEALSCIVEGLKRSGRSVPTETHILNTLVDHHYFQVVDREEFILSTIPPANPAKLRQAREDMGMSIAELSKHLKSANVVPSSSRILSLYEQGVYPLVGESLKRLSSFYGKSPDYLTEMSEEEREKSKQLLSKSVNPVRLRQARKELGLYTRDVAKALGISETSYDGYEVGTRSPRGHYLLLLSKVLQKDVEWLCEPTPGEVVVKRYGTKEVEDATKKQTPSETWKEHLMSLLEVSDYFEKLEKQEERVIELEAKLEESNKVRKAQWGVIERQKQQLDELINSLR